MLRMEGERMKFYCYQCCDEVNPKPCILTIPCRIKKGELLVGLTICPFECADYIDGDWECNGEKQKASWGKKIP